MRINLISLQMKYLKKIVQAPEYSIPLLEDILVTAADIHLKTKSRPNKSYYKFSKQIIDLIKIRRNYNKQRRKSEGEQKKLWWLKYQEIKREIKKKVALEVDKIEKELAMKIKDNYQNFKWREIRKLMNKEKENKEINIILKKGDKKATNKIYGYQALTSFWKDISQEITPRSKPLQEIVKGKEHNIESMAALLDHDYGKESHIIPKFQITEEEVSKAVKRLKNKKATGLSKITAEMIKIVCMNNLCLKYITRAFNNIHKFGSPTSWSISKVILLSKTKSHYTYYEDFRPITLTEVTYRVFTSILKDKLMNFLSSRKLLSEEQSGFISGRRFAETQFDHRQKQEQVPIFVSASY